MPVRLGNCKDTSVRFVVGNKLSENLKLEKELVTYLQKNVTGFLWKKSLRKDIKSW